MVVWLFASVNVSRFWLPSYVKLVWQPIGSVTPVTRFIASYRNRMVRPVSVGRPQQPAAGIHEARRRLAQRVRHRGQIAMVVRERHRLVQVVRNRQRLPRGVVRERRRVCQWVGHGRQASLRLYVNAVVWLRSGSVTVAIWLNAGSQVTLVVTASGVPARCVTDVTLPLVSCA